MNKRKIIFQKSKKFYSHLFTFDNKTRDQKFWQILIKIKSVYGSYRKSKSFFDNTDNYLKIIQILV